MGPLRALKTVFRNAFVFRGRSKRSEYWWFLFFFLALMVLARFADIVFFAIGFDEAAGGAILPINTITFVLLLLPMTSVEFRRLQDVGLPGWPALVSAVFTLYLLVSMWGVPTESTFSVIEKFNYALWLVVLIACLFPSQKTASKYGPNPHEVTS